MGRYVIGFYGFATTTSNKTAGVVAAASARNMEVYDINMSGAGTITPADIEHVCNVGFLSAAGPGTGQAAQTPEKLEQSQNAALSSAAVGYGSTEPTTYNTVVPPLFSFNQRSGMRWGVPIGTGFKTDGNQTAMKVGQRVQSNAAGNVDGNMFFYEP